MQGSRRHLATRTTVRVNAGKNEGIAFPSKLLVTQENSPETDSPVPITGTLAPESLLSLSLQEALVIMASVTHWLCNSSNLGHQTKHLFVFPAGFTESREDTQCSRPHSHQGEDRFCMACKTALFVGKTEETVKKMNITQPHLMTGNMTSLGARGKRHGQVQKPKEWGI